MRISTGLRIFSVLAASASLTAAFIACSGSDDQDVISQDAGQEASVPDTFVPDTGPADTGPKDSGPKDSGPQFDAGPATVLDGGDEYEGGIPCVVGGLAEEEINDEPDAANPLDPADAACVAPGCSRCGIIFQNDPDAAVDAGTEPEYVSFDLHPSAKSFYLQFAGDITMTVTVDTQGPFVINASSSPALPFVRDKTYYVKVTSNTGKRTPWRVTLFEVQ